MKTLKMAEKRAERLKKEHDYKEQSIDCCLTCGYSRQMSSEDPLTCYLLRDNDWCIDEVSELGLCNKFESPLKTNQ